MPSRRPAGANVWHEVLRSFNAEQTVMGMPQASSQWTADRVRNLPDDGKRYELVSGELVVTPAPRPVHQMALAALYDSIAPYLAETGIGRVLWSPADLSLGEDEVLQPDLFVFPEETPRRWSDIAHLLLVIEVTSPSTARYDRQLKRRRYQRGGVQEYWVVDLDSRLVERWRPDDARPEILDERLWWQPDPDAAPLEIDLVALFDRACGPP